MTRSSSRSLIARAGSLRCARPRRSSQRCKLEIRLQRPLRIPWRGRLHSKPAKVNQVNPSPFLDRREKDPTRSATFVALCLILPMLIVVGNFAIGARAPITAFFKDDISLIDPVWRLVQGNQLGIDYHDPRGFGFFYLAALLWNWLGPHYYVLRA